VDFVGGIPRDELTQHIYNEATGIPGIVLDLAAVKKHLWYNYKNNNSFRLTENGYHLFVVMKLPEYEMRLPHPIYSKTLLQLERYIKSPYYIRNSQNIVLFSSKEATILILYANNLKAYLDNLEK